MSRQNPGLVNMTARARTCCVACCLYCMNIPAVLKYDYGGGQSMLWLALPVLFFHRSHDQSTGSEYAQVRSQYVFESMAALSHEDNSSFGETVDGTDDEQVKSKGRSTSAGGASGTVTRSRSLPVLTGLRSGDTSGGSGGEEPPESNDSGSRESYGKECLPVWADPESSNTVIFKNQKRHAAASGST